MLIGLAWMNTCAEGLTFGVVVIGVVLGLIQWNRQLRHEAAVFLKGLLDELRSEEVVSFLYDIDYDKKWYGGKFHEGKKENKVDRALSFLSFVCYLRSERLLGDAEFAFFDYELARVLGNRQVIDYLYNLHHFSARQDRKSPFEQLINYGVNVGLVEKNVFSDPTSYKRVKYLHKNLDF